MHFSIVDKPFRKELSLYSRRGFRPSNKAKIAGLTNDLELTYVAFLMQIPGLSENKAIALARTYPTLNKLMQMLKSNVQEKDKKNELANIQVQGSGGEQGKKIGKAIAEKVFQTLVSADPNITIN